MGKQVDKLDVDLMLGSLKNDIKSLISDQLSGARHAIRDGKYIAKRLVKDGYVNEAESIIKTINDGLEEIQKEANKED